jgi:hypothetical protein
MVKGFVRTLESTIGVILILTMLVLLYSHQTTIPETQLVQISYNCLEGLDNSGYLKYYAINDVTKLEHELTNCLPPITDFKVKVCDIEDCIVTLPDNKTVVSSSYLISGYDIPKPYLINLWVWSKL